MDESLVSPDDGMGQMHLWQGYEHTVAEDDKIEFHSRNSQFIDDGGVGGICCRCSSRADFLV
jgi:hypothetical protein